jgi:catechol 2,3-dioxygenase-like lactoylglutathione lyase family enzyme
MMPASTTVFTVKDVAASRDYFRDRLGFNVAFEWGAPTVYVGLLADKVRLHLIDAVHAPRPPGHAAMVIDVDDIDALYAGLMKRGAKVGKPPKNQPYGMREFDVADLDGNMIFFGMELKKPEGSQYGTLAVRRDRSGSPHPHRTRFGA